MRRVHSLIASILIVLGNVSVACASITASWVSIPITAMTDNGPSNITGYQCWDLVMDVSSDDRWIGTRIFSTPTTSVFHHPFGNNTRSTFFGAPDPALFPTFPTLPFTSYVQRPGGGNTIILGSTDGVNDLPSLPDNGNSNPMFDGTHIALTFGDLTQTLGEDGRVLRFTFFGPPPTFSGLTTSLRNLAGIPIPQIPIPEPSWIGTLTTLALFARARRRIKP